VGQKDQTTPDYRTGVGEVPDLEVPCPHCEGDRGITHGDGHWSRCPVCDGAGYKPTEVGKKVLALMRHNFRPMHEDMETGPLR